MQHQNLAARKQWRDHFKRRILGSRADQDQGSSLHMGQEIILLRFVEVVYLVHKKHGAFAETLQLLGFLNDLLEIFDSGGNGWEMNAVCLGGTRQDLRQSGFAAAWRPPQNE